MKDKDIKLFMMSSGEIVVAEVLDAGPEHYETSMPSMLVTEPPNGEGKSQVGLAPYCPYGDPANSIIFYKTAIQSVVNPTQQLKDEYKRIWGSPSIVTPEKKLIV